MQRDPSNIVFNLAADLVNHTSRNIFLTGKAGTGKTTFLKYIKSFSSKKMVVVAPTGVAAINAGGVTMHSFFQLPMGTFLPHFSHGMAGNEMVTDRQHLLKSIRFSSAKKELIRELELLVIDEVSMVRSDMLDAVDAILRHVRKKHLLPFGGVQVLFIGDLFQLPPVVSPNEWNIMAEHYESPFFFHSKATKERPPIYIELKKIYRQSEQHFIDTLNRIRNNAAIQEDLDLLNNLYDPGFEASGKNYITLTTHNQKADKLNAAELEKLEGRSQSFRAEVTGDFPEKAFPAEPDLKLKPGAQVMFIKNDSGEDRKFYNGKLATIQEIGKDKVIVCFEDGETHKLEKETWRNIRYVYDQKEDKITEDELGSYKQYPVRLAWAVTIHKSQGLTFERAVIDAGAAFAPGQVYVALSRCTSLSGIVLHSKITRQAIRTDERVLAFSEKEIDHHALEEFLIEGKKEFEATVLKNAFDLTKLMVAVSEWQENIPDVKLPEPLKAGKLSEQIIAQIQELEKVQDKFSVQLGQLIENKNRAVLIERVGKAILYFSGILYTNVILPIRSHYEDIQHAVRIKKYLLEIEQLQNIGLVFIQNLNKLQFDNASFNKYELHDDQWPGKTAGTRSKNLKGNSQKETLELYRSGKTVEEIALLRNLATSTIESHLGALVGTGDLSVDELVVPEKKQKIFRVLESTGVTATSAKHLLGEDYTYAEIRAVINHKKLLQQRAVEQ
jgi:hypothetical protein